uniref:T-complex protein 1 subunit gamma n=1 Tax=Ditylenchus dipsaci TaxID=166011 RepID=A0A915D1H0_9BILA
MFRGGGSAPMMQLIQRESGAKVQSQNINAAKMIADVIRTSLGPRAMLKMLMDPMGGIIARTQDEETGDGTTSVIVLTGEVLGQAEQFLDQKIHPTVIIQAYRMALEDMILWTEEKFSKPVDVKNNDELATVVKSCLATKMISHHMDMAVKIAIDAVTSISVTKNDYHEVDIKRYCRIEKIPGGSIEDSCIIKGIVINKDIVHPKMKRRIEKPRVILLDCPLEYKKGESQTALEIMKEEDFSRVLEEEETAIKSKKGISDLAQHFLIKAGITALRRLKKTDNNRLARVTGAHIVNDTTDLREEDVGTLADLYEIKKIGDEYFTKDIINEVDRNIQDAVNCVRNVLLNPKIVPGAGSLEMALAHALEEKSKTIEGNCGGSTIRQITALRAKHAQAPEHWTWGINGLTGELADVNTLQIWDPLTVRIQVLKTAIETSVMLLRIDDIVSGSRSAMMAMDNEKDQTRMEATRQKRPKAKQRAVNRGEVILDSNIPEPLTFDDFGLGTSESSGAIADSAALTLCQEFSAKEDNEKDSESEKKRSPIKLPLDALLGRSNSREENNETSSSVEVTQNNSMTGLSDMSRTSTSVYPPLAATIALPRISIEAPILSEPMPTTLPPAYKEAKYPELVIENSAPSRERLQEVSGEVVLMTKDFVEEFVEQELEPRNCLHGLLARFKEVCERLQRNEDAKHSTAKALSVLNNEVWLVEEQK